MYGCTICKIVFFKATVLFSGFAKSYPTEREIDKDRLNNKNLKNQE